MPRKIIAALLVLVPLVLAFAPGAARAETRIALVIGNAGYQAGALNTPANDAGLIAQTLQAAGFDVVGARDLDQDSLRRAFRDFVEKAQSSGPDTVAFVYLGGYGLQLEGENYFAPIDAKIARDTDVAAEALRLSDYTRQLSALKLKASIVVLDAARANPFAQSGSPLAGGLALVDPDPGMLIAFNAAPGTVAPEGQGSYGPYAQALAEMLREGGLPLADVFDRTRLRVNDLTKGAQVPWQASKVEASVVFFERAPDAPPPAVAPEQVAEVRARPIREFSATEAYTAALERDTLDGYNDFVATYPDDPMAARVRAIIAARREAITWRRTRLADTPAAYWSYLQRYPDGPHAPDAHRRLAFLSAALEPPPTFALMAYDVPPPPPEEIVYIRRPVLVFDDPVFAFAPPPPPPVVFLAPPPPEFVVLEPPPPPIGIFLLPVPVYRPVPVWCSPPAYVVAPPANNVIFTNVHNTVVINNVTNTVTVTNPAGNTRTITPAVQPAAGPGAGGAPGARPGPGAGPGNWAGPGAPGRPAAAGGLGPALPPSVAQKAALQAPGAAAPGAAAPGAPAQGLLGQPARPPLGQPLPGLKGSQPAPGSARGVATTTPGAAAPAGAPTAGAPGANPKGVPPTQAPGRLTTTTPSAAAPSAGAPSAGTPPAGAPSATAPSGRPGSARGTPKAGTPAARLTTPPLAPAGGAQGAATPQAQTGHAPTGHAPTLGTPGAASPAPSPGAAQPGAVHPTPSTAHAPPAARLTSPPPSARPSAPAAAPPPPPRQAPPAMASRPPAPPPPPRPAAPPPPPPPRVAAPPPAFHPAAAPPAMARPPAPPPPPPQARGGGGGGGGGGGCPPGKSMAMVGGHPTCR